MLVTQTEHFIILQHINVRTKLQFSPLKNRIKLLINLATRERSDVTRRNNITSVLTNNTLLF